MVAGISEITLIEICGTLADGKELLKKSVYELVFLDLCLPDSNGIETISAIHSQFPNIPIIVFTSLKDEALGIQMIEAGAQDYLVKGEFNLNLLRKAVFYAIERHKNLEEVKKALENLSKAEEIALLGNWEFTLDGSFSKVSLGVYQIYGLTIEDEISSLEEYLSFILPEDVLMVKKCLAELSLHGDTVKFSARVKNRNGQIRYLDTTVACFWKNEFGVLSLFGATIDVTESKLTQIKLKESEVKLLEAQVIANIGSWEYDFSEDKFNGSAQSYKIFDLDPSTIHNPFTIIHQMTWGSDSVRIYKTIKSHIHSREPFSLEFKVGTHKGANKYVKVQAQVFFKSNSQDVVIRGTVQDVTVLKEAELVKEEFTRQLEIQVEKRTVELVQMKSQLEIALLKERELGDLKTRFISTASHQFRTPLTVIQSSVGFLDMQSDLLEEKMKPIVRKVNSRIKDEVVRMTNLMNDVLILGEIETRGLKAIKDKVEIVPIIESVIKSHNEIQLDKRKANLVFSGTQYDVELDPNLFEHAFSNILSNAFKYSFNKKAPQVILIFTKQFFQVRVKDFGIGIPQNEQNSLFEPFFRASNISGIQGTGLGTAIVKEYVELMNGEVDFNSEENKGSEFILTFNQN
jgi:signal transduction histidine kinase/CheY-like chemotaxis protein